MSVVFYLLRFLLFGALLRLMFERRRKQRDLRKRVAELEAELAFRDRDT